MPYLMVEPIRELLDAGVLSDHVDMDERWSLSLREEILEAKLTINSNLLEVEMSLREIQALKAGDIIPIDMPDSVVAKTSNIPIFNCKYGSSSGYRAIKIEDIIVHMDTSQVAMLEGE